MRIIIIITYTAYVQCKLFMESSDLFAYFCFCTIIHLFVSKTHFEVNVFAGLDVQTSDYAWLVEAYSVHYIKEGKAAD